MTEIDAMILDIHTHSEFAGPESVLAMSPEEYKPEGDRYCSLGIHPWNTGVEISADLFADLEEKCRQPNVVAIGECGIDLLKGGPMFRQMNVFRKQVEISERLAKPLIIHDVKAHDIIMGLHRDLNPSQNWLIHGFRGKPALAAQLVNAGLWLSFGEKFNPETLKSVPHDRILAETDESSLPIRDIIARLSECAGSDLLNVIISNTAQFLIGNDQLKIATEVS